MKKIILFLCLFLLFPAIAWADFDLSKWQYYKDITGANAEYARLMIDDEIFAGTKRDLTDLRIINNDRQEIPYKLLLSETTEKIETYFPKLFNNSFVEGQGSSVILDFGANPPVVNRLAINTTSSNFQLNVMISGSSNMQDWQILKDDAYIYDYTDSRGSLKTQNTTLNFNDSLFRYLQLEILGGPIKIDSVAGYMHTRSKAKELLLTPDIKVSKNSDNQTTEIYLDLKSGGIPINKIKLSIEDNNFNRGVLIYSSYDNEKWHSLGQGYIFKYNTPKFKGENLTLDFAESSERHYLVVIRNYDNEPLHIGGAQAFSTYRELIFQSEAGKSYQVYYGNPKAKLPIYDIDKFFQYLDLNNASQVSLSAQKNNESFLTPENNLITPKSETVPNLMTMSLIIASLLLVFLVYRFLKAK